MISSSWSKPKPDINNKNLIKIIQNTGTINLVVFLNDKTNEYDE